jgi:S-adenosylmethionine:tRNA-ribosyltransferase-isomerase (queuine synthetase)
MLPVAAFAAALMAFPPPASNRDIPHLRTSSPLLAVLMAEGREHSATFRELSDSVEASDVIVYFEATPHMEGRFRGRVHFVGAAAGFRYLRLQIRTSMSRHEIVSSMAHELQHAKEIAAHREVTSENTLAALYRQIGDEHDWCMFETSEAQQAGRAVRLEILGM